MSKVLPRLILGLALVSIAFPVRSYAQSSAPPASGTTALRAAAASSSPEQMAKLEQQVAEARSSGDNAWMLVSAALVLMMTGPGLALFYGGLVRKKNVLATIMQSFTLMALVTVLWALFGYSLAFHAGTRYIGNLGYLFLQGVGAAPNADYAATIPQQTFMVFQLMFAIITPALITGAFAERMKFSALVLFMVLWTVAVYDPMAHMVWGKGGLLNATLGGAFPTLDFAGGTVVHITAGVSALVCALYLGKRLGYPHEPMPPHSVVLSSVGACLLWVGWFGFNAGSALAAGSLATSAFVATHFAAAAAALGWAGAEWVRNGKPRRARSHLRIRCRLGGDHPSFGFCRTHARPADRTGGRRGVLFDGRQSEKPARLRRFSGCLWRARRGRDGRSAPDRGVCRPGHQPHFQGQSGECSGRGLDRRQRAPNP